MSGLSNKRLKLTAPFAVEAIRGVLAVTLAVEFLAQVFLADSAGGN
jgi:hypothetical protein